MLPRAIELTNSMSDRWAVWVVMSLAETTSLLVLAGLVWLIIRRHVSPQVGYCLFLLVPLKLLLPFNLTVPAAMARWIPTANLSNLLEPRPLQKRDAVFPVADAGSAVIAPPRRRTADEEVAVLQAQSDNVSATPDESVEPAGLKSRLSMESSASVARGSGAEIPRLSTASIALLSWAIGVAFLSARLVQTQLRFRKRLKHLERSEGSRLDLDLGELCRRMGITRNVQVIVSNDVTAPAVGGIMRASIILPNGIASELTPRQLQWVLLHELAHIRRGDLLVVVLQRLASVLHFFNPSIWIANRIIHRLREYACDDLALSLGDGSAVDSGEAFLQILKRASDPQQKLKGALGVFGLDSRAACFARVRRLMETDRPIRLGLDRLSLCGLILTAAIVLPRINAAQETNKPQPANHTQEPAATGERAKNQSSLLAPPEPDPPSTFAKDVGKFELTVVDPDGKPIPNADVELRSEPLPKIEQVLEGRFVRTQDDAMFVTANSDGRLVLQFPRTTSGFDVRVMTPGYGPYRAEWSSDKDSIIVPAKFTAELEAGSSVGGLVVDEEGQPIQGARIRRLVGITYKVRPGGTAPGEVSPRIMTDETGKWRFDNFVNSATGPWGVGVVVDHPDFVPKRQMAGSGFGRSGPVNSQDLFKKIVLERGLTMTGKVTDDAGNPIAGGQVHARNQETFGVKRVAVTGEDGVYSLRGCEPKVWVVVSAKDRATDMRNVSLESDPQPENFELKPGRRLRIRVVDEMDRPIPNAFLRFQGWRDVSAHFAFAHVNQKFNDAGVWEWNEAPLDEFDADICRPNGLLLPKQILKARDEEYVFRLPSAYVVVGKVVDAQTKEPIKTFQVTTAHRGYLGNPEEGRVLYHLIGRLPATDGIYRIEQTNAENSDIVDAIQIESNGYQPTVWQEIMFENGLASIDLALNRLTTATAVSREKENVADESEKNRAGLLPPQCETVLKQNLQSLQTCSIRYSENREPEAARQPTGGQIVLDEGRFYLRTIFSNQTQFPRPIGTRRYSENSFDGHIYYHGNPDASPRSLTRYLGENPDEQEAESIGFQVPYLDSVGYWLPKYIAEWRTAAFDSAILKGLRDGKLLKLTEDSSTLTLEMEVPDPSVLYARKIDWDRIAKVGNQQAVADRYRKLSQLDPMRRVVFKLDRDKGYALVRQEDRTPAGKLIQTIDCEDFEYFPKAQLWLPRTCVTRGFANIFLNEFTDEPAFTTTVKLDEISFVKPEDVSFKIDYGPGSSVIDLSIAKPKQGTDKQPKK